MPQTFSADTGAKYQISTSGGTGAVWSRDRNELIWVNDEGRIMSTPYQKQGSALSFGPSRVFASVNATPLISKPILTAPGNRLIGILSTSNEKADNTAVSFFHFHDELKRRFAAAGQ